MSVKRVMLIAVVASAVMLAVGIGPRLAAQEPDPPGVAIAYPGRLSEETGQPVADGTYDFAFALYDAPTGGERLWSEVQEGVAVAGGTFAVRLGDAEPIPATLLGGGERWLAVGVRGPGEAAFTDLTPRQRVSVGSPAALARPTDGGAPCPHDHWGEAWLPNGDSGTGLVLASDDAQGLHVRGHPAVYAESGLLQLTPPGGDIGVYGYAADIGIYGWGTNFGVGGSSAEGYGGFFRSDSDHLDLALGGPVGRINTDPHNEDSQLYLSSNADVIVKLDNDGGEDHTLRIQNSGGTDVCTVSESGVLKCTNTSHSLADAALYGVDGGAGPDDSYGVYSEGDMYGSDDLIVDDEVVVGGPLTVFGSATFFGAKSGYVVDVAQNGDAVALETGDVVVISGAGPAVLGEIPVIEVRRATPGEASAIVGVVDQHYVPAPTRMTAAPGGKAESASFDDAPIAPGEYLTLVTLGAFKAIKVDASYGKIAPGDLLAASPNPGYAMRAVSPEPGTVVGKALGALESGTGVIPVMVTLQ